MAINNSLMMLVRNLQEIFRDKTTGAPLRNGVVYFWKDNARTVPKDVFKQTGVPGNYTYIPLENPLTLSSIGTFQDPNTNDDINVYYYPYNEDDPSTIENYFIEVYSQGGKTTGVQQWTRENWPGVGATDSNVQSYENFVPNPQFLLHNDIPATDTTDAGEITDAVTTIAQGGWTFERPGGSTAKDLITFTPINYTTNPMGNPPFAVTVECETADAGDTYKDLRLKYPDVNQFASTTQYYTFAFTGKTSSSSINVSVYLIKNYDGATDTDEINLGNFTLDTNYTVQPTSFIFGSNSGETITDNSFLQLAVRFPTNSLFEASLTDFILTPNQVTINEFPDVTEAQVKAQSLAGWIDTPTYDGSNLFLTPRLTKYGMTWDTSEIGQAVFQTQLEEYEPTTGLHATTNLMLMAGKKYITSEYSDLGIPFSRLFNKYFDDTTGVNIPRYGTGLDYMSCAFSGTGNQLIISNNSAGAVTDASNGATSPGFTIGVVHQGDNGYDCKSYLVAASTFYIENTNAGVVTAIAAGTSTFTVSTILIGTSVVPNISSVQTVAASALSGGEYYSFYTYDGGANQYYNWFTVDGVGADPAPGGTGILTALLSTDDAATVAQKIRTSLNGFEVTSIQTVAASSIPAGAYFLISATGDNYYVWYKKDGAGTDPNIANRIGIQVDIVSATDTNTIVATKTQVAMNSYSFASPDPRGYFLRVANSGTTVDPGVRWSMVPGVIGTDKIGTFELSQNLEIDVVFDQNFIRDVSPAGSITGVGGNDWTNAGVITLNTIMGSEARPINMNLTLATRY